MLLRNDFYSVLHCTAQLSSVHPIQRWHTHTRTHRHSEQEYVSSFFLLSSLALIFFSPLSLFKLFSLSLFSERLRSYCVRQIYEFAAHIQRAHRSTVAVRQVMKICSFAYGGMVCGGKHLRESSANIQKRSHC